ncbi:hypothetical protein L2E82_10952 [Cichorium intybus]|uniref:Uncharacterized protein n=1 Tax=Cichorium intybus TaxID=13427 RepID=A0ACB9GDY9_CICIN|nr:hypothetical protein L2E82_10952 [Cichorium intybus]
MEPEAVKQEQASLENQVVSLQKQISVLTTEVDALKTKVKRMDKLIEKQLLSHPKRWVCGKDLWEITKGIVIQDYGQKVLMMEPKMKSSHGGFWIVSCIIAPPPPKGKYQKRVKSLASGISESEELKSKFPPKKLPNVPCESMSVNMKNLQESQIESDKVTSTRQTLNSIDQKLKS